MNLVVTLFLNCSPLGLGPWRLCKDTNLNMRSVLDEFHPCQDGFIPQCMAVNLVSDLQQPLFESSKRSCRAEVWGNTHLWEHWGKYSSLSVSAGLTAISKARNIPVRQGVGDVWCLDPHSLEPSVSPLPSRAGRARAILPCPGSKEKQTHEDRCSENCTKNQSAWGSCPAPRPDPTSCPAIPTGLRWQNWRGWATGICAQSAWIALTGWVWQWVRVSSMEDTHFWGFCKIIDLSDTTVLRIQKSGSGWKAINEMPNVRKWCSYHSLIIKLGRNL